MQHQFTLDTMVTGVWHVEVEGHKRVTINCKDQPLRLGMLLNASVTAARVKSSFLPLFILISVDAETRIIHAKKEGFYW